MGAREKNLVFCCLLLFFFVVQGGLNFVDSGLTRLLVPEKPFTTASIMYRGGFVIICSDKEYSMPSLSLGSLGFDGDSICISHGDRSIRLPRYIVLGELGQRNMARDVDKMPP